VKDYSQNGEGAIIAKYFGDKPGVFLSCVENDGVCLSNVRALALLGWSGVCVEPAAIAFAKLAALYAYRPDVQCIQAAITDTDGPVDFWDSGTHLKQGDTSLLSTTRPEELARWMKSGEKFTKTTVRGITIATLLKETGLTRADFISIDCEGVDYRVLTQIDLMLLKCRMLCVEVNRNDPRPFVDYAAKHGMRLHHRNYENAIFCV
jgi:FkbM family methyltransferase